ncbi:PstS family phosphate ABC transporter substrate-binding protein [Natronolimnohabitans innermongolicus]|uniref:ABC-type phosphate transporter substrate-binding component n=1 Tax=Natronolimnohabitans innermongolicus JCM 12255 TaxID=1227499 RepID=L9WYG7_9EURY|nr:substrate-binding domain-containing protein [Natronolimnohabitans innermongolicus]ELY53408.1 ABC-type phosphate transporter substrate-binding component [Natronolimnohabitans innermongolicus JCM 12255]
MERGYSRRSVLGILGSGSTLALAGCLSGSSSGSDIRISGGVGPLPMMQVWADKYESETGVGIDVSGGGTGVGVSDVMNEQVDIAMMGREPDEGEIDRGLFAVAMLIDTVVGTINVDNPVYDELREHGLTRAELEGVFTREITNWDELVDADIDEPIYVYGRSDSSAAYKQWGNFLGGEDDSYTENELEDFADGNFDGDQQVAQAINNDALGISMNNLNYVYDYNTGDLEMNIRPIPLDLDESGTLSAEEDYYETRDDFLTAVEEGFYPAPPAREMFIAANEEFEDEAADFAAWVLTEGQQYVRENGYAPISDERLAEERDRLEERHDTITEVA